MLISITECFKIAKEIIVLPLSSFIPLTPDEFNPENPHSILSGYVVTEKADGIRAELLINENSVSGKDRIGYFDTQANIDSNWTIHTDFPHLVTGSLDYSSQQMIDSVVVSGSVTKDTNAILFTPTGSFDFLKTRISPSNKNWSITSDSLALMTSEELQTQTLLIVKSCLCSFIDSKIALNQTEVNKLVSLSILDAGFSLNFQNSKTKVFLFFRDQLPNASDTLLISSKPNKRSQ